MSTIAPNRTGPLSPQWTSTIVVGVYDRTAAVHEWPAGACSWLPCQTWCATWHSPPLGRGASRGVAVSPCRDAFVLVWLLALAHTTASGSITALGQAMLWPSYAVR